MSNGTISNFTPAGLFLLKYSAMNWKLLIWFWPTGAIRPVSGSIQATLTVSPFCAKATVLPSTSAAPTVSPNNRLSKSIVVSLDDAVQPKPQR